MTSFLNRLSYCKKKISCVKIALFDTIFRHFCRNSFPASSLYRFQPTSTIRSVFLAKLCVQFVNNCRFCSSHVCNQGNHCRRQEHDPISPIPAMQINPALLKSAAASRCLLAQMCWRFIAALSSDKRLATIVLKAFRVCLSSFPFPFVWLTSLLLSKS